MVPAVTYVVQAPGITLRLGPGQCVRIGRHASNDLVLDHSTVSRFHARLRWPEGEARPTIEDLGSANGTRLDGAALPPGPARLEERALLDVGDVRVAVELEHVALIADDGRLSCRLYTDHLEADESGLLGPTRDVRDLLLDLERGLRTGTLLLEQGAARARLTFAGGWVVDASTGQRAGLRALEEVVAWADGARYRFVPEVEPRECPLRVSARAFLAAGVADTARTSPPPRPPRPPA